MLSPVKPQRQHVTCALSGRVNSVALGDSLQDRQRHRHPIGALVQFVLALLALFLHFPTAE